MIGYEDRFVGIKEMPFVVWEKNRDISEETYIPCKKNKSKSLVFKPT